VEESAGIMKRWRRFGAFFGLAWLFLLVLYAAQEAGGRHPPPIKLATIAAAVVFAALYSAYWISTARTGQPVGVLPIVLALCAIATGTSLASYENWSGLFIFCAIAAGYGFELRRAVPATIGVVALAAAVGLAARASPDWFVVVLPVTLLTGLGMVAISRMVVAYREVRLAREETARLAVTEERLRFARDLHDLLGHSLSVIVLKAELAGKLMEASTEGAAKEVHDIERVAREALREVRDAVSGYREPALSQEVEGARQALQAAGIRVSLEQKTSPLAEVDRRDEVVAAALESRPDVALLDIEMPGSDGITAAG
jgi:two-component system, NarL family, sensor histidine kinase DesK